MCGIAGWFESSAIAPTRIKELEQMSLAIEHRGPDGVGHKIIEYAAFAHRRLAIIDLAGGQQPMLDDTGQVMLTFNGEIYNYQALKIQLEAEGCQFRSASDTEVILQLYQKKGIEGFSQLRGMYAFGLWDNNKKRGYLVRDPLGIKPLFYRLKNGGQLSFGSEAKAITARKDASASLDESTLHLIMNFRYIPTDQSLFKEIYQLRPGEIIQWQPSGVITRTQITIPTRQSFAEPLAEIRDSVKRHLIADVEVGCYLSGGMDSATIAVLAKSETTSSFRTFTLDVGDDPLESVNAAKTAQLFDLPNIQGTAKVNLTADLAKVIWHMEMPKVNAFQVYLLAQHASQHVKVVMSGLGGDELFLGYNIHRMIYFAQKLRSLPVPLLRLMGKSASALLSLTDKMLWTEPQRVCEILQNLDNWPKVYGLFRNVWDAPKLRESIYGPRMLDCRLPNAFEWLEEEWPDSDNPIDATKTFEWETKMVNDLLWQEDRCSMAVGLESRVPFVDVDLKQSLWQHSPSILMPGGHLKQYMRATVGELLPNEILNRPKSGFQVDSPTFFKNQLSELAKVYLSTEYVKSTGLFNPTFVYNIINTPASKKMRWHYFMLYLMLGSHIWVKLFEQGVSSESC